MNDTRKPKLETQPAVPSGHDFNPAEKNAARSATTEAARGNPAWVSPRSSLDGAWIEIFRAGDYGDRGAWSPEQLDQLAAAYHPRLHAAPVVLGHPADDAPAYGWVRRLRRAGHSLWAQLEKVDPAFEALLRAGRFAQRSVSLYKTFPLTGRPYLRHLGFLGAAPPAVKGLAPVRFTDAPCVAFAFDNDSLPEVAMPEPKSKLESFLDHLRAFFATPEPNSVVIPSEGRQAEVEGLAFAERLAALERRLEALTAAPHRPESSESALPTRSQVASFVESLRSQGRFPPAFDHWGVREFMERLAAADSEGHGFSRADNDAARSATLEGERGNPPRLSPADDETSPTLVAWFHDFLTKLPTVIEFRELGAEVSHRSAAIGHRAPLVRFTEPHRGMTIDPASLELAERAEALAAELDIPYAEALTRLRQERRHSPTTA